MKPVSRLIRRLRKQADDTTHFVAYIRQHPATRQQPPLPTQQFTKDWMAQHGVGPKDAAAMVYKYLELALRPDENS